MLEDTLRENGILDKPCQLFNTDEMGMPLDPKPPKGSANLGKRAHYRWIEYVIQVYQKLTGS